MGNHLLSSFPRLDSVRLSYSQSYSRKRAKCRKASFFCSKMDFLTLLAISGWQTILDDLAHMYLRVSTKQDRLRPSSCWVMAFSVASKTSKIGHFPIFGIFAYFSPYKSMKPISPNPGCGVHRRAFWCSFTWCNCIWLNLNTFAKRTVFIPKNRPKWGHFVPKWSPVSLQLDLLPSIWTQIPRSRRIRIPRQMLRLTG